MRAVLLLVALLSLLTQSKARGSKLQRCQRRVRASCKPNAEICVRISRSNLCQLRSYSCKQRLADCRAAANGNSSLSQAFYRRVNRRLCSSNQINQSLPCASTNNSSNSSNTPIIYA